MVDSMTDAAKDMATDEVVSDPKRSVVLQRVSFEALQGKLDDYHLYALPQDQTLRIETLAPAQFRWSTDGSHTVQEGVPRPTGLELLVTDLPAQNLPEGAQVAFTFFWVEAGRWEGENFAVTVEAGRLEG